MGLQKLLLILEQLPVGKMRLRSVCKLTTIIFAAVSMFYNCGCSSIVDSREQKRDIADAYVKGKLKSASDMVNEKSKSRKDSGDAVMWFLESGLINFEAGKYQESLKHFENAEAMLSEYDDRATVSVRDSGAEVGSAVTNLNAIPYRGFCYDRILLNVYKAMVYFAMHKPDAAGVELRRMRETQKNIERKFSDEIEKARKETEAANLKNKQQTKDLAKKNPKVNPTVSFKSLLKNKDIRKAYIESGQKSEKAYGNFMNPFSTYMSAVGYLFDQDYNEANVDFRNLYRMNPNNPLTNRDYVTCARRIGAKVPKALKNIPSWKHSLDKNIVFVIFANGRGPALKQVKIQLVLPFVGYTGIAFPVFEYFKRNIKRINLEADSQKYCTGQVVNMDNVVSQEYHERLPTMITRLVVSYLVKETASLIMVQSMKEHGDAAQFIAYGATGVYKYLFNTADTRCWESLPGEYQIVHFPIPKDRKVKIALPGPEAKLQTIKISDKTNFSIIYIRGINDKVIAIKTIELK